MNTIQIFNNIRFGEIRTTIKDSEPWFVAADVCRALEIGNPSDTLNRLDEDERTLVSIEGASNGLPVNAINEPGLYTLILGSRKPEARIFKRWITHEVIPAVRAHGVYATDKVLDAMLADPDYGIRLFSELKIERKKRRELEYENAQSRRIIGELSPKASYYDMILQNKSTVPISQIAKDYGMSGRGFNKLLHDLGVQFKQGDIWLLYQNYANQGYTQSRTHAIDAERSVMHTCWTQKGRLFLHGLLKDRCGLFPAIERMPGVGM